ncbi:MAG: NrfD/PsrC family molybdoenzyme membrane anchor subunit [Candidatus Geothermarchaeales archaeon]
MERSDVEEPGVGDHEILLRPLTRSGRAYYFFIGALTAVVLWGVYAWYIQLTHGLIVTGLRDYVFWGVYITNFVFFIGIAHVGALVSGILRVTKAEWGRPIMRMAEVITISSLPFAALMPLIDLGRFDRILNVVFYGRLESPVVWDFIAISTYMVGSSIFLYVPLIPDIAVCRDRLTEVSGWRRRIYKIFALGWVSDEHQWRLIKKATMAMAITIIGVVFIVHTVVSWIFGMTLRVGWNSTIFGPYFVMGAILSGVAVLIIAMWSVRRVYHFEAYLRPVHFKLLGWLLFALDMGYLYFTVNEYLTVSYKLEVAERGLINSLFFGEYLVPFWFAIVVGLIIPALIVVVPKTRSIPGILIASMMVFLGLWIKRYVIIVPTLTNPYLPASAYYMPTWIEWSITAGAFAGFVLLFTLFSKYFPIVSVWEVSEGESGGE